MYRSGGGGDVNVPALPVRRSAVSRQSPSTPPRQQTFIQQQQQRSTSTLRTQLPTSSSSSSSLANLDSRVDSSRSRVMNDYRDFPTTTATLTTTTTTTPAVQPSDSHSVSRSSPDTDQRSSAPPRDVRLSWSWRKKDGDKDDQRTKKEKKTLSSKAVSECRESIVCQRCGRCRCQECARHHPATGRRAVEICSCVSCVRRVVAVRRRRQRYDWNADDDDDDDDLCVCSACRADCCRRWTLLVLLSVCLPCLCFYWPLRCVVGTCSRCAQRQMRGCRCIERSYTSQLVRTSPPTESVVIDRVTST